MRIDEDVKLDFKDVLIRPKRSTLTSRNDVNLEKTYNFPISGKTFQGIPIIASNMSHTGTFEMSKVLQKYGMLTALHKHYSLKELQKYNNIFDFYSMGITESDWEKLCKFVSMNGSSQLKICIDVANGYQEVFVDFVKKVRDSYPQSTIMAGNIVTGEMVEHLILSGADIVKVGIGPGSVCTTRIKTGVGYPQLSSIIECADSAHGLKGLICADGGCTVPGDIAKAFGAGADFVMLGSMLAGYKECNGDIFTPGGHKTTIKEIEKIGDYTDVKMEFYGMSSTKAQEKYDGGLKEYRASEGKTVLVDYKGSVKNQIQEILGGLRSACTYVGAKTLKEFSKRTTFIKINDTHNRIYD